ncbi:sugar ABC transporter substrate-binding protein [Anoxynatronum sibiricum]|uniref:Substrate-binding domain-containing protein n=1 Tax=Anoxynatronum sibiricum TaxID=210623 RepID=A0ABU9VXJ9_9CLOT
MKKMSKKLVWLLLLVMVTTLFTACSEPTATSAPASNESTEVAAEVEKPIKIGISLPTQREERWVLDKENFERVAEELGVEVAVQIADNDAARQQSQCENLISQGVDVLIIAPHDGAAAANIVNMAHEAGIKVISYDRLIMNSPVDLYLTFDSLIVGEMQAEWVLSQAPTGNIALLAGDPGDYAAVLYRQGALNVLQPKIDSGDITLVLDQECKDWQPSEALRHIENVLTVHNNDIQGIVAPNDGTAGAAIQALAAQGLAGKVPVSGQDAEVDAIKRIIEGTQGITIFNDIRDLGRAAIESAIKFANNEPVETKKSYNNGTHDIPTIEAPPALVDINNYLELVIESGFMDESALQ